MPSERQEATMKYSRQAYLVLLTAVGGIPFLGRPASAQIRVDTAGHAMDANTQVGSGGYNSPSGQQPLWSQYQNALVTGNASGGFSFSGRSVNGVNLGAGYADPFAFRGLLAGQGVDQFIANSTGVPTMANPTASSANYAAGPNPSGIYYGAVNHTALPSGFQTSSTGQGYVPAQPPSMQSPQDPRLGAIDFSGSGQIIPKPYEMILPGPVDPTADPATAAQQMLAANPIFGVVPWTSTQIGQPNQTSTSFGGTPLQQGITPQIAQGLTQVQVNNLRQQLISMASSAAGNQKNLPNTGGSGNSLPSLSPGGDQPLSQLNSRPSPLQSGSLSPAPGDVSTDQSTRQYLSDTNLPPPSQQSPQYAKLRRSIEDYNSAHSMTDEQANQRFQQILRLREQANVAAENGANVLTGPGAGAETNPEAIPGPEQPISPEAGGSTPKVNHQLKPGFNTVPQNMGSGPGMGVPPVSAPPVPIDSFAQGIPAKGLADLIARGDVDVQKGQYDKAIAAYNQAIDVVPNNPLILTARAIAELGGGYYAQANSDLHVAISADPAVLMGQYDLQKQFGEARLKKVVAELKDIATNSPDNTLHSFLLTFCYYNSRHVGQAADWLQITDKRGGGQDPAIVQMKKYWNFNDEAPIPMPPAVQPHSAVSPQSAGPATQPAVAR
jgi:tetratricopeptide (TPR) repeat protein